MGCPDFWDTPCCIFAADNNYVELKYYMLWLVFISYL
jgi:hypothetical protein